MATTIEESILSALAGTVKIEPIVLGGQKYHIKQLRMSDHERVALAADAGEKRDVDLYTLGLVAASLCDQDGNSLIADPVAFAIRAKSCDLLFSEGNRLWKRIADLNLLSEKALEAVEKNFENPAVE